VRLFTQRVRAAAVPLDSVARRDLFERAIGSRRIVALGESHHFVHETYALRAVVLDDLESFGFRHLGVEIARTDGVTLDHYLRTGSTQVLDRVGTFGYLGPGDRPYEGILGVGRDQYPAAELRGEYQRLLDGLRDPGRGSHAVGAQRWSVFGFDIDYLPGVAAERLDTIQNLVGSDPVEVARARATLEVSRRYEEAVRAASDYAALSVPMAWRETLMTDHVLHELGRIGGDAKVVLAGHNLHVGAGADRIEIAGGVGPGGGKVAPLGAALAANDVDSCCMWMLHDHGADSGPPPGDGRVRSVPGSLNAAFAQVGPAFAIATDALPEFDDVWAIASMFGGVVHGRPAELCDVLLFVAETSVLRP
jgi:hypothetical protein